MLHIYWELSGKLNTFPDIFIVRRFAKDKFNLKTLLWSWKIRQPHSSAKALLPLKIFLRICLRNDNMYLKMAYHFLPLWHLLMNTTNCCQTLHTAWSAVLHWNVQHASRQCCRPHNFLFYKNIASYVLLTFLKTICYSNMALLSLPFSRKTTFKTIWKNCWMVGMKLILAWHQNRFFTKPPTMLQEGNIFTGVCHSVQRGGP